MNINNIKFASLINNYNNKRITSFKGTQRFDTFEKSTPKQENPVIKWMEETDFVKQSLINTINNPDNRIGKGFTHSCFIIPENNEYILRTRNVTYPDSQIKDYEIKDTEDKNLTINIGQQVAEIHLKDNDFAGCSYIEVLKKQSGETLGVKPSSTIYTEDGILLAGELPYDDISRKEKYESSIHKVSQMPVEAFEKLLDDIKHAEECGYFFDHLNSNNILVDAENQSLNLIDMEKGTQKTDCGSILYALTNINYFSTYKSKYDNAPVSDDRINKTIGDTIEIINKFTTAMKRKNLKFDKENCRVEAMEMFLSPHFSFFCRAFDLNEKWENLKEMGLA